MLGGVDIHRVSGVSDLFVSYTGGGMFSTGSNDSPTGPIQELSLSDRFSFRRWTLAVFDQTGYLPESSFGFAGAAGAGFPGVGTGPGLGSGFTPGQSILTGRGRTYRTRLTWKLMPSSSRERH